MNSVSIILPALNEERYLGQTLACVGFAVGRLKAYAPCDVEIIVVDNGSDDDTAEIAKASGAVVLHDPIRNIARARNVGARAANGDVLFFLDADTHIPANVLVRIGQTMEEVRCVGGAVDTHYTPSSRLMSLYLSAWRVAARLAHMAQGCAQFYRRHDFLASGGYDESLYMGEDVEFYWLMRRRAKAQGKTLTYIEDVRVKPSARRFDLWPVWKTLFWTNPLLAALFRRRKSAWHGWYEGMPR